MKTIFKLCVQPHPRQAVPAAEFPGSDVGGAGVAVQHNEGSLRVSHKVKLSAHCGVTPGYTYSQEFLIT